MLIGNRTSGNGVNRWVRLEDGVATGYEAFLTPVARNEVNAKGEKYEIINMRSIVFDEVLSFTDLNDLKVKARQFIKTGPAVPKLDVKPEAPPAEGTNG